ncbi:D-arabinono-1,4-lactone oxidase [Aldersonia kunmingensis]|uniref:D-arabinono-1,4-lactone oxidase n=1 Tax=Aldersonia kunmingensis TaxID=408066 RepID=UPI0008363DE7|nr:D-arabinono-1,4-lactone oxidase [Aldersonia kunmingensis]
MTSTWVNWAGYQMCRPAVTARPESTDELRTVLAKAAAAGHHVRVAGAGHSFTDAVLTDGALVSLERLNRVLDVDSERGLVRVQAGISLAEASERMHEHGFAFPNLGDINVQSLAGATATGTHGTGAKLMNLSAPMHSIELMLADGSTIEVNAENDPDAWRAARVSIGALGIVTAITVEAVPSFVLEAVERPIPLDEILADLDGYIDGNDHFEFYVFPHSPLALTKRNNRTDKPEKPTSAAMHWINSRLLQNYTFEALCKMGRARPSLIPGFNRFAARVGGYNAAVDRSYRIFSTQRDVRMNEMEYAIPREHAAEAIRRVKAVTERAGFDVPFPIEVRWVAGDDAFLSPATGRDTCYIAVHMYTGMVWEPLFREVEKIFEDYDGRPHWGKRHFQTAETLRSRYPEWDRFIDVRKRLDPNGLFSNAYTDRVLGPVG